MKKNNNYEYLEKKRILIPNLVGKNFKEIVNNIDEYSIVVASEEFSDDYEKGTIISQTPISGSYAENNFTIVTKVSKGSEYKVLPEIQKKTLSEISLILTSMNLIPFEIRQPSTEKEGTVLGYYKHSPNEKVKFGERIAILVSSGP
ncbi:MAG: PASTA domain-containing protein [Firmicutes bacterium]|nr:PASTA domain-containing protein [Bacillota bacterium]